MTLSLLQAATAPPATQNPLAIAAYIVGVFISVPVIVLVVKVIFFLAKAMTKLDLVDQIANDVKDLRDDRRADRQATEFSLTIIESDVNDLQRFAELPVRPYPDRRTGPADRRASA